MMTAFVIEAGPTTTASLVTFSEVPTSKDAEAKVVDFHGQQWDEEGEHYDDGAVGKFV